jgi:formate dehydrogenase subunit delta
MDADNLIHMANRIGEFFQSMPDRTEALDGIAQHIRKFWEPRMRHRLGEVMAAGGEGLSPILVEALQAHGEVLA